jgi:hypothetical protein
MTEDDWELDCWWYHEGLSERYVRDVRISYRDNKYFVYKKRLEKHDNQSTSDS